MVDGDFEDLKYDVFVESKQAYPTCICPHCELTNDVKVSSFGHLKYVDSHKVRAYVAEIECIFCYKGFYVADPDTELHPYLKATKEKV